MEVLCPGCLSRWAGGRAEAGGGGAGGGGNDTRLRNQTTRLGIVVSCIIAAWESLSCIARRVSAAADRRPVDALTVPTDFERSWDFGVVFPWCFLGTCASGRP